MRNGEEIFTYLSVLPGCVLLLMVFLFLLFLLLLFLPLHRPLVLLSVLFLPSFNQLPRQEEALSATAALTPCIMASFA